MLKKLFAAAAVAVAAPSVFAAGSVDYTALTSSLDFSPVTTGAMAIGVAVVGMYAAIKGVKIVIGMVKSA